MDKEKHSRRRAHTASLVVEGGTQLGMTCLSRHGRWEAFGAFGDKIGHFKTEREAIAAINARGQEILQARDLFFERQKG
jgi:hypothetical protein